MSRSSRRAAAGAWLLAAVLVLAGAAPPHKEIGHAHNTRKTASAAGAEQYSPTSYKAAADAYRLANEAVMRGDYRLALNRALESREHAQSAEREAREVRERMRSETQQTLANVATLLARAGTRLDEAGRVHVPPRVIREARQTVARLNGDVQEASAVMEEQDYASAQRVLTAVEQRLTAVIGRLETAIAAQSPKRAR
jgi:hypothetical protein